MSVEALEQRMALAVSAPTISLAPTSDTGVRGDGVTSSVRPVFTGAAPPQSRVVVWADGTRLLGVATATPLGRWSLATPLGGPPLANGGHVITAYALVPRQTSQPSTSMTMAVDAVPPTAQLAYDTVQGIATVTFSKPVSGVSQSSLFLSGRTVSGLTIPPLPVSDARLAAFVGQITLTQSPDRRTYTFQEQLTLAEPGTYTLTFRRGGAVDSAGNRLAVDAARSFTIL